MLYISQVVFQSWTFASPYWRGFQLLMLIMYVSMMWTTSWIKANDSASSRWLLPTRFFFSVFPCKIYILFNSVSVWGASCRGLRRVYLKGSARLHFGQLYTLWQPAVQETGVHLNILRSQFTGASIVVNFVLMQPLWLLAFEKKNTSNHFLQ